MSLVGLANTSISTGYAQKENQRMSTCHPLDLQTLASQPVMPKKLHDH